MFELIIAVALIALNGVFSLSELAIVSARKSRLRAMRDQGRRGAHAAVALSEDPGRFLSTVQIGITLVGIVAGAFSGAALSEQLTAILREAGVRDKLAQPLGFTIVIGAITYLSVVVGELVPKHFALRNPETIACIVAPLMRLLSRVAAPVVWLLDTSTRLVFRLLGVKPVSESVVTEEEIRTLVAEAEHAGVIESDERSMIAGVLRLGDRTVRGLLTPRTEVDWLDLDDDEATNRETLFTTHHSRLPVMKGDPDDIQGVVHVRDLLAALVQGEPLDIASRLRKPPIVPDTLDALEVVKVLRDAEVPMAIVHDEYGHFEGIVTPADALDAIVGAFRSDTDEDEPEGVRREDGSWLISGAMPFDEMADLIGIRAPENRAYETAAGFVIDLLQHLPATGEHVSTQGWRFEVIDLDGMRVDKILASRIGHVTEAAA
ncbi:hemolysin family protein [Enterovirga rhinocerotis]|uniref:Putative hemolysin n=1 Tax=Enterovirga rhinocerotis TaxID=1339210 RepID=A0A4R7C8S5_9HYPH|nr:hemolysin family protein [Enterovirga rhinocerotis]TDR94382.1 putative hemolysin [Enterovirga rhinocerotis]